nr:capsid protein [Helianthus annus leaf-associated cryptic virus 2]
MADANNAADLQANAPVMPQQANPPGNPGIAHQNIIAVNQQAADNARARQQAAQQQPRFASRRNTGPSIARHDNETIETAILATAMNFPPVKNTFPSVSKFVPNAATILHYLQTMDTTMISTRRWTENCGGWVPPISQIYISVLFYVQVMRAMDTAGCLPAGSEISLFLREFLQLYPLESLWIPGPLVTAFKSLSSFCPDASGIYGNVTPSLTTTPGWTLQRNFCVTDAHARMFPNISIFISRYESIITAASVPNATEVSFNNDVRGPHYIGQLFGHNCNHGAFETLLMRSPGAKLTYGGSLRLWQEAAHFVPQISLPANLDSAATVVNNRWVSFLRFDEDTEWFGRVSAIMSRYCQFWRGSAPLADCPPTNSPAGAIRCHQTAGNLFDVPAWVNQAGAHNDFQHGNANAIGHYRTSPTATFRFRTTCTIQDMPLAYTAASQTFNINTVPLEVDAGQVQTGQFWLAVPDVEQSRNVSVFQGVYNSIIRDYHNDQRISADQQ